LKIGYLPWVNAIPLFGGLLSGAVKTDAKLVPGTPAELNAMLARGEIDVSLISAAEYLRNRENYILLSDLCIAADGPVQSVILHVRGELRRIALSPESATSANLVKMFCRHFWNISPEFVPLPDIDSCTNFDGFLLIGDKALLHPRFEGYQALDLAAVWHEKTQLPLPFALFAARKGVDPAAVSQQLQASLTWGEGHREKICKMAQSQSKLPMRTLQSYYPLLRYRMGEMEMAGLKTYQALHEHS
jgi:predicted solute-binding protein